jgi:hypothetical protein
MARPYADEEEEKPLDPGIEKVRRKLIRFMGINLGLLFLALMVVVAALVYKARKAAPPPPSAAGEIPVPANAPLAGDIVLPVGSRIVSQSLSGNRVSLDVALAEGGRAIFVYDLAAKRIVGRFAVRTR